MKLERLLRLNAVVKFPANNQFKIEVIYKIKNEKYEDLGDFESMYSIIFIALAHKQILLFIYQLKILPI